MKKLFAGCAVLFLALGAATVVAAQEPAGQAAPAASAAAPDVTGTWSGNMQGPNGDMTISFHFEAGRRQADRHGRRPDGRRPHGTPERQDRRQQGLLGDQL